MFLRFEISDRDPSSTRGRGVFSALYDLERGGELSVAEAAWFHQTEAWFDKHLEAPKAFREAEASREAVFWFRADAIEHISRMRELVALLEEKSVAVSELRSTQPGYVIYEDAVQLAAVPFRSTPRATG